MRQRPRAEARFVALSSFLQKASRIVRASVWVTHSGVKGLPIQGLNSTALVQVGVAALTIGNTVRNNFPLLLDIVWAPCTIYIKRIVTAKGCHCTHAKRILGVISSILQKDSRSFLAASKNTENPLIFITPIGKRIG